MSGPFIDAPTGSVEAPAQRAAIIGGGVIGAGWAARLIENGIDVQVCDPAPDARPRLDAVLDNADHAYARLSLAPRPARGAITLAGSIAEAVANATLVVESVPERLDIKQAVYRDIEATASEAALITSSTSGILPSDLQRGMRVPGRLLVAHPFNPVYLLPVVEIVAGQQTSHQSIEQAMDLYTGIGMKPIHVKKEIEAFVADRLLESIWREALWLIHDGICTTEELDDIVRYGFGLRYAQMGVFETCRVAGGEAGMRHFMAQFGPCLSWPWSHLTDVPEFTNELVDLIAEQSDAQSGHLSIRELERIRDANLVAIQQALKANDWGAGQVLAEYEKRLYDAGAHVAEKPDYTRPVKTLSLHIPADWADYNGHMNEARYLQCFSDATDALTRLVGCDANYIANDGSWFTVETHLQHLAEVQTGEAVYALTQVIAANGKKLHLFHSLYHINGTLLATGEHFLLHVSLESRTASEPAPAVAAMLAELASQHARLPAPDGLGRAIGQRR